MRKKYFLIAAFLLMSFALLAQGEFSINFFYGFVNPSDFNANARGATNLFKDWAAYDASHGYNTNVTGGLKDLKNLMGGSAEFKYFFSENLAFGAGFAYQSGSKSSSVKLEESGGGNTMSVQISEDKKAKIYIPYVGLHFIVPANFFSLDIYGNAGYFMGSFPNYKMNYYGVYNGVTEDNEDFVTNNLKKSTVGAWGGLRLNMNIQENMGFFIFGEYRYVNFKELKGNWTDTEHVSGWSASGSGDLYYYEVYNSNKWYEELMVRDAAPSGSHYRNVRKAELNFSGFFVGAGFFIKF